MFLLGYFFFFLLTLPRALCQSQLISNECKSVTAQVVMILFYNTDSQANPVFFFLLPVGAGKRKRERELKLDGLRGVKKEKGARAPSPTESSHFCNA